LRRTRRYFAQSGLVGTVGDGTGAALPGVSVQLRAETWIREAITDAQGNYRFAAAPPGPLRLTFALINFAGVRRDIEIPSTGTLRVDVTLQLSMDADVTVTGKATFTNLADVENPAQNLVGIAQAASQGAITARQLDARPVMRGGEVLETVPGVVISQHSGEGKANQYYSRGFNLDHGTDFTTSVAGMPVNMPTHGHGHGYSDLNFLMPELISGVQFSKGPYFAESGDFATAGAASINYVNSLARPLFRVAAGVDGHRRAMTAASVRLANGDLLGAIEIDHNDGPWTRPDDYRKINALVRYTRGNSLSGWSLTGMAYRGTWSSTDQIPERAVTSGLLGRFDGVDPTDGGDTYRYSGSFEWQRTRGNAATRFTAYGIAYDMNLFSNSTYFLDRQTAINSSRPTTASSAALV
jgi:hypothetical protein